MKINSQKFYSFLFVIVLFSQLYLPSFKLNIVIQIFILALYFFLEGGKVAVHYLKFISPLFIILLVGFIGTFTNQSATYDIVKDLFHFIKPILGISLGYLFFKKINNFKRFVTIIVVCGFVSAIIHFLIVILTGGFSSGSINDIREFSRDNFLELFALFFLIYFQKFNQEKLFESQTKSNLFFLVLLLSTIFYFSRTMLVVAVLMFLSVYDYTRITRKTIKKLGIIFLMIGLFYVYLFSIKIERNKPGIEAFLFKIKIAPQELFKTKIDRENHKDLWDHWRGYEAKRAFALMEDDPKSYLIGTGHGSLVNLKFFAPLTNNYKDKGIKYISELHNGYAYVLYKTGLIGFLIHFFFLIKIYNYIYDKKNENKFVRIFISSIGVIYIFTTITITGIYNNRDIIVFLLGALLYFFTKPKEKSLV